MKIETDEWITLSDVVATTDLAQKTVYRIVDRLGLGQWFFGVRCIRKADVPRVVEAKMPYGNPRWRESGDDAAEAAIRSVESRMKRTAKQGLTEAEKQRNKHLADAGRRVAASRRKKVTP